MRRDFWVYFAGQTVSQVGSSFTNFALPLLVFKLTGSPTNLALTTAAEFVPYLLFGLVLGAVVDRADRKRLMISVDLVRAAVIAVLPVLSLLGVLRVEEIYAVAFVQATMGILFDAGEFAAVPSLVGRDQLVTANARIMATNSAGQIAGPVLAGALVALLPGVAYLLFVDAGTFLTSAVALLLIRRSFNDADPPRAAVTGLARKVRSLFGDVREGLAYVLRHPVLRSISLMMALINFVSTTTWAQLVLFGKRAFGASDFQVAVLYAAGAAGIVIVSAFAGPLRRRLSFPVVALGALVVNGVATVLVAVVPWYAAAVVLWAAAAGFGLLLNINTGALRQAIVPSHMFGRVISIAGVLAWSANPLGALAGAAAIEETGNVRLVYLVIGILTATIAIGFAFSPIRHGERYLAEAAGAG
ncbi:MAG TPA: MFS transporter [Rugosimonospora sp.]|nr:MFS transporter [Rugosimonospora sp.]